MARYRKRHGLCITKFCRGRRDKSHAKCSKCRLRAWRAKYPIRVCFRALVDGARARKILVGITYEEFEAWAIRMGLVAGGVRVKGHTVDRKDAKRGYFLSNMQVLTGSENVAKGNRERHEPEYKRKKAEWDNIPF